MKTLEERRGAVVLLRSPRTRQEKPQNPLGLRVEDWNQAIRETDRHSLKCRACNRRRHPEALAKATGTLTSIDPFKPCREAVALHDAEVAARKAYIAAGGTLPVNYERLRRMAR